MIDLKINDRVKLFTHDSILVVAGFESGYIVFVFEKDLDRYVMMKLANTPGYKSLELALPNEYVNDAAAYGKIKIC
jgi:hypothetical protein